MLIPTTTELGKTTFQPFKYWLIWFYLAQLSDVPWPCLQPLGCGQSNLGGQAGTSTSHVFLAEVLSQQDKLSFVLT